uniref:Uncharacterized protein n=1 Tax=Leersia perrieri TaxID=77586 RepID=A0A0D9WQY6_9ORYZ
MAPTWMTPRQTAHSVQLAPLPLCLTSRSYMNAGTVEATVIGCRQSSSSCSEPAVAPTWHRRASRLYSEKRQKPAAADAVTEKKKRRLSGDISRCMVKCEIGDTEIRDWLVEGRCKEFSIWQTITSEHRESG